MGDFEEKKVYPIAACEVKTTCYFLTSYIQMLIIACSTYYKKSSISKSV